MTGSHKLLGQQIDQYRVLHHIDRGGMADVYLAEDVDLERKVALKVMLETLSATDPQFAERFRREAITVAKLDHPNIVQVYTVGQTIHGQPYIAMQYIEGGSLQDKLTELADRQKLLTTEQALNIVRQIAQALSAAHQIGIVHRDLKPANVLVRPDGAPVLVDLGIAAIRGGEKLTHTGGVIGTPAYMSPEQVRGKPVDGRSDLYALGIMLYEILAGMRPFEAEDSVTLMHQQVYENPLPLNHFRPDLSPQTLEVVAKVMSKDPSHRYQKADEMVQAIDQAILAEGLSGPNPQATIVLTQMNDSSLLRRSKIIQAPTAVFKERRAYNWPIVLLLVLILVAILFFIYRSFVNDTPVIAYTETATATAPAPETVAVAAVVVVASPTATATFPPPTATSTPPPIFTATAVPILPPPEEDEIGGLSGLGINQIAYASDKTGGWNIYALDIVSNQETPLLSDTGQDNSAPVWSPDGSQVAFHSERDGNWDIYLLDIESGDVRRLTTHEKADLFPTWSPDGTQLAFHSTRGHSYDLFRIDVDTLAVDQLTDDTSLDAAPDWSPDGFQLLFETTRNGNSDIYLLNLSDLSTQPVITNPNEDVNPVWSPNGQQIAFSSGEKNGNYDLFVANADGTNQRQLTTSAVNDLYPTWSPDGTQIIYESWTDKPMLFQLEVANPVPQALTTSSDKQRFPDWLGN